MTDRHWMVVFRAAALLALGTSLALLLDYVSPQPAFCSGQGGCAAVRQSPLAYVPLADGLRLPLPAFGVLGFGALFVLSLWPDRDLWRRVGAPLVFVTAGLALVLVALQFAWGQICPLCMMVDTSALVMAGAWWRARRSPEFPSPGVLTRSAWAGLAGLVLVAALLYPKLVARTQVPDVVAQLYQPGQVTVVEFFDFQCPHCRELSPRLGKLVAATEGVGLRLGYVPLPNHPDARPAARMAICALEQGKEKEVAAAFFAATSLSRDRLLAIARPIVPNLSEFDACLSSSRPDARIADDTRRLKEAGFVGLPTTYVGGVRILGARDDAAFEAAIQKAKAGEDRSGMNPWVYWMAFGALAAAIALTGRRSS